MTKIISMFNHKGGVAKTTDAYNIAWALTEQGKKVLLVDADSQCNLTKLILNGTFDDYYEENDTKFNNLKDAVSSAFAGNPEPIKKIICPKHKMNENLFIIPGHMDLSSYDPQLNLSLTTSLTLTVLQNLPGAFYKLITECSQDNEIDYVIIDLNPSLSSINQVLFMSSDGFIIPTNPDPFSIMALKTLKTILPRWKKEATSLSSQTQTAAYPLPIKDIFFLGEIISRFNIRSGKPNSYYINKINEIKQAVNTELVLTLRQNKMIAPNDTRTDFCLAEIKDFGGLQQTTTGRDKPIIALNDDDDLGVGAVKENNENSISLFRKQFTKIANTITEILN